MKGSFHPRITSKLIPLGPLTLDPCLYDSTENSKNKGTYTNISQKGV
jgi:hypothetical protein